MVQSDHTQAAGAAASQKLRRHAPQAFDHLIRARARRHHPEQFSDHPGKLLADQVKAAAAKTGDSAVQARSFIFMTAHTTDDGHCSDSDVHGRTLRTSDLSAGHAAATAAPCPISQARCRHVPKQAT